MFRRMPNLSVSTSVDAILDKESFTLEELLDEEEIIQECRALNSRLINFLQDRVQVEQLLHYIVDAAPEDADSRHTFKFPFIACEIFTCEIDVILRTLVEDEELMHLLFSFLEPSHQHSSLLAGYFSKVVVCLMLRKTKSFLNYVQVHDYIFQQLVDLIGIKSIMEVLIQLVGVDDHMLPEFVDVMHWLADSHLLEMIVDKLSPMYTFQMTQSPPEVHANAAEVLWAVTHNAPSALATKLSSPSFVLRIFDYALEDTKSKSSLVHSLSVSISLLDPKRSVSTSLVHSIKSQHSYEPKMPVDSKTITAMLRKLDHLLSLLDASSDESTLPTTYGVLQPPLGKHRLKIVEFIAVLLGTANEAAQRALVALGAIQRIVGLFFEYPFNNVLHHHVENVIMSCLLCADAVVIDHLFCNCNIITKLLQADKFPIVYGDSGPSNHPTLPVIRRQPLRAGNIGHITRIANKLVQVSSRSDRIRAYLQENDEWTDWQTNVLNGRNTLENVYRWACGRPSALQERMRDSDDDELHDRDYDIATLTNNFRNTLGYNIYKNDDVDKVQRSLDHDAEDVYFDDESTEVVISSLRLGDDGDRSCLFTNSNWFAFKEDGLTGEPPVTSNTDKMDEVSTAEVIDASSCGEDEVVIGEDEEMGNSIGSVGGIPRSSHSLTKEVTGGRPLHEHQTRSEKATLAPDVVVFEFEAQQTEDLFDDQQLPDWVGFHQPSDIQIDVSTAGNSDHSDAVQPDLNPDSNCMVPDTFPDRASDLSGGPTEVGGSPPSFEDDMEFVGVDLEAMERATEGESPDRRLAGETSLLNRKSSRISGAEIPGRDGSRLLEFGETSYWQVEQEAGIVKE